MMGSLGPKASKYESLEGKGLGQFLFTYYFSFGRARRFLEGRRSKFSLPGGGCRIVWESGLRSEQAEPQRPVDSFVSGMCVSQELYT